MRLCAVLFMAVTLVVLVMSPDVKAAAKNAANATVNAKPQRFVHPRKNYTLFIPAGARIKDNLKNIDLSIQSSKGYAVTLQSGAAKPQISFQQMLAKLEALYLGTGKAWSNKLSNGVNQTVSGLSAYSTVYEGRGSRTRVVIVRGRINDFVFMFFASPKSFIGHKNDFAWMLSNFHPAADEFSSAGAKGATAAVMPLSSMQRFAKPGFAYGLEFPDNWVMSMTSANSVMFSGRKGTPSYYAVVSIRDVEQSVSQAMEAIKSQINTTASAIDYLGEGPFIYDHNGLRLKGTEMMAAYDLQGQRFKKWTLILPKPASKMVYVWSYTSPQTNFEQFRHIAEAMRQSWSLK